MKNLIVLSFLICLSYSLSAQSDSIPLGNTPSVSSHKFDKNANYTLYKHEIGVETSAFFSQIFRLFGLVKDTQRFPVAPYVLNYKYHLNKKSTLRAGVGMSFSKNNTRLGDFADSKIISVQEYNTRLGYQFENIIDSHWLTYIGADITWGLFKNTREFDSGFDKALRYAKSNSIGGAAVLGGKYLFSPRISLGIEMSLGFNNIKTTEKDEFTANPQFNKLISTSTTSESKFFLPGSLFFNYNF